LFFNAKSQNPGEVNMTDLIRETQQWAKQEDKMRLAWWIPNEYWRISLAGNKQIPSGTIEQLENVFRDYILICAADIIINMDGSMLFRDESEIRKTITIEDERGKKYKPLSGSEISLDAAAIAQNIKPMFAQVLGQMGQGMHFFFFSVQNNKNEAMISATKPGGFTVIYADNEFKWTLPLATLLPPKFCPVDKEKMQGNWKYCPIHGKSLDN